MYSGCIVEYTSAEPEGNAACSTNLFITGVLMICLVIGIKYNLTKKTTKHVHRHACLLMKQNESNHSLRKLQIHNASGITRSTKTTTKTKHDK